MIDQRGGFHRESRIAVDDPEFSVRLVAINELKRILSEAKESGWSARWTSEESLVQQVDSEHMAVLCPLFRNGGPVNKPRSYRCHLWFVDKGRGMAGSVSLLDVSERSFHTLREVGDPSELNRIIRILLDGVELRALE